MRYTVNLGATATYSLFRGRGLGGLLWVLPHFGAGGGFGVGMAAIRHVLSLNFLFAFGIFPLCEREIGCLPPPSANRHEHYSELKPQ